MTMEAGMTGFGKARGRSRCSSANDGFTLIELLISLLLCSVIFVSAYQVLSNLVQYQVRSNRFEGSELDQWLLANLLGEIIEMSVAQVDLPYRYSKNAVFKGNHEEMTLISRAYSRNFDSPGYRSYRLFERKGQLWLAYRAFDGDYQKNREFETRTGLELDSIEFEYLSPAGWVETWRDPRTFPDRIRVSVGFADKPSIVMTRGTNRR